MTRSAFPLPETLLASGLARMTGLAETVEYVCDREQRMTPHHPRAGKTHDLSRSFLPGRLVAVYRAVGTCRFPEPVRALVQTTLSIIQEFAAFCARRRIPALMVRIAIDADHDADGTPLPLEPIPWPQQTRHDV